ncbi:MAG: hypothetical protein HY901_19065 [Deltaproteobacteria bacterium]|nr:hypothetical protein [Deltaproteobacteria bacterium]
MAGLLFTLALLAALGVFAARRILQGRAKRKRKRTIADRPGYSPDKPVKISGFDEIDDAIAMWRCPCGGLLDRIGEGSRPGMRVVRCVCVVCEEDVDLFFDLSELRH